ncbi:ABC transporter ATP-binding protein [Georgenia sp. Z1491]|uniref:ABC transporter ATP-binding protein n=1 Tax=Georgenia sp. Z1491 TaxID=3416707 RepID=UPI003CE9132A
MVNDRHATVTADAAGGLVVDGVSVVYPDGHRAVDAVSLSLAPGEVLAVVGASGSGKSSLLRAVAGLEPLASGAVRLDGADLAGVPVHRRGVGLLFQDGQLFDHLDVAGNVAYGLRSFARAERPTRAEREQRVAELLELVGLADLAGRAVTTLSGGQAQRVALARALAPRPRAVLLDEPLSALDRALRERLAVDLSAILRAAGATALHVTHDLDEAATVADRIAVLSAGRLRQVATPRQLWSAPADREVAELLGHGPVLPASALGRGADGGDGADGAHRVVDGPGRGEVALAPGALVVRPVGNGPGGPSDDVAAVLPARATGVRHVRGRTWVDVVLEVDGGVRARALVRGEPGRAADDDAPDLSDVREVAVLSAGIVRIGDPESSARW